MDRFVAFYFWETIRTRKTHIFDARKHSCNTYGTKSRLRGVCATTAKTTYGHCDMDALLCVCKTSTSHGSYCIQVIVRMRCMGNPAQ